MFSELKKKTSNVVTQMNEKQKKLNIFGLWVHINYFLENQDYSIGFIFYVCSYVKKNM